MENNSSITIANYVSKVAAFAAPRPTMCGLRKKPCKGCGELTARTVKKSEFSQSYICEECAENE